MVIIRKIVEQTNEYGRADSPEERTSLPAQVVDLCDVFPINQQEDFSCRYRYGCYFSSKFLLSIGFHFCNCVVPLSKFLNIT